MWVVLRQHSTRRDIYLTAREHLRGYVSLEKDALPLDVSVAPGAAPGDVGASLGAVSAPRTELTLDVQVGLFGGNLARTKKNRERPEQSATFEERAHSSSLTCNLAIFPPAKTLTYLNMPWNSFASCCLEESSCAGTTNKTSAIKRARELYYSYFVCHLIIANLVKNTHINTSS